MMAAFVLNVALVGFVLTLGAADTGRLSGNAKGFVCPGISRVLYS